MKKKTGIHISLPFGIGIGIVVSLVISLLGAAISAWMIAGETLGESSIPYATVVIVTVASLMGALVAAWLVKGKRLVLCAATGAGYYLCLIANTALFFGGRYQGLGISALAVLIGCAAAILMGIKGKKGTKHKIKIPAYR